VDLLSGKPDLFPKEKICSQTTGKWIYLKDTYTLKLYDKEKADHLMRT